MKKKTFLNGLSAKLALAVVALTSTMLTSCEKENFNVNFEANPAKVYITPTVIDAATNANVTAQAEITGTTEITGTKNIAAQSVEITATVNGVTGKATVSVAAIPAGSIATYTPTILLSSDFELVADGSAPKVVENTVWGVTDKGHKPSYNHDGKVWFENATEYIKNYKVTYDVLSGEAYTNAQATVPSVALNEYIAGLKDTEAVKKETAEFKVSAWSLFYTVVTYTTTTTENNILSKASKEIVGKVTVTSKSSTTFAEGEIAHPSHASHYVHGHGTHGTGDNAGGGIIIAD
ncbi:DUF3869 domain-containing protein [Phocaeicola sp.]